MDQGAFVIRPLRSSDFDWLYETSRNLDPGLTSLPSNKEYLRHRVDIVDKSFKEQLPIAERVFLFVREELTSNKLVGIAGIQAIAGPQVPFYNFQISTVSQLCEKLEIYLEHNILSVVNNFQAASELISLWLHPDYRGKDLSKCLSLARFLFMAQYSRFFSNEVIAEIRGVCDSNGNSPFWNSLGRHFFAMDFTEADYLTMSSGKQYISDLMPRVPIYVQLLSEAAQQVIGEPHPTARAAAHRLHEEGFKFSKHVDIFDAGPLLHAHTNEIKTIANSKVTNIKAIENRLQEGSLVLISNNQLDVRITANIIDIDDNGDVTISNNMAKILELAPGDQIRYCPI